MISTYKSLGQKYIHFDIGLVQITISKTSIVIWVWQLCFYLVGKEFGIYIHKDKENGQSEN